VSKLTHAVVTGLLFAALPAAAHEAVPQRGLVVQVDDEGVAALWSTTVAGPVAELMRRVHDRDADGRLSDTEATRLASGLVAKATRGVEIAVDGVRPAPVGAEARLAQTSPSLVAVGLVALNGPDTAAVRHRLAVRVRAGSGPIRVQVQALGGWRLAQRAAPAVTELAPGGRLEIWIERAGDEPQAAIEPPDPLARP
jgi:hypothetical protein